MKIILKVLKWVGIVILATVLLLVILLFILFNKPFVPGNYMKTVETGGELEAKYLAMGQYDVKHTEADAPEDWGKFITYYPADVDAKLYETVVHHILERIRLGGVAGTLNGDGSLVVGSGRGTPERFFSSTYIPTRPSTPMP